jgi:hypothetical protein
MAARRRRGEDGISFEHRGPCRDPERHRHCPGLWRGEITLGYTSDGKRARRKVSGTTRTAVVDKLRELHSDLRQGVVPKTGYANYTVRQAAEDWLANGLTGRSAKTAKKNQNMIEPILKVIGTRRRGPTDVVYEHTTGSRIRGERCRIRLHIGRSQTFSRLWFASIGLFA